MTIYPLCEYNTFCLSVHQLMDVWVVSTFRLLWIMLGEHLCTDFCVEIMFLVLLAVELLCYMVTLCLTLWGTAKQFPKVTVSFYIPTSSVWGFYFLYMLGTSPVFFMIAIFLQLLPSMVLCPFWNVAVFVSLYPYTLISVSSTQESAWLSSSHPCIMS